MRTRNDKKPQSKGRQASEGLSFARAVKQQHEAMRGRHERWYDEHVPYLDRGDHRHKLLEKLQQPGCAKLRLQQGGDLEAESEAVGGAA